MRKIYFLLLTALITISLSACISSKNENIKRNLSVQINKPDEFETIMNKFLYSKSPDELFAITIYLSEEKRILNDKNAISPMTGFYMGIIHEQPDLYKELKALDLSKNMELVLKLAETYSQETEDILNNRLNKSPKAAYLDLLWGYFYATGDKRVTNKICQYSKSTPDMIVRGAASWSYKSNMEQFPDKIKECK